MQAMVEYQMLGNFSCDCSWSEASRRSESNSLYSEQGAMGSISIKLYRCEPEERDNRANPLGDPEDDSWPGNMNC